MTDALIDYSLLLTAKALSESNAGGTFNYVSAEENIEHTKIVSATRYESNVNVINTNNTNSSSPSCGYQDESISLPATFNRDYNGTFDCVFMSSTQNNFIPSNANSDHGMNRKQTSPAILSVKLFDGEDQTVFEYNTNDC